MDEYQSVAHTKWDCKYHVVFIPKCRRRTLYVQLRKPLGEVFRQWAGQKESRIEEGHMMIDHIPRIFLRNRKQARRPSHDRRARTETP